MELLHQYLLQVIRIKTSLTSTTISANFTSIALLLACCVLQKKSFYICGTEHFDKGPRISSLGKFSGTL